MNTFTQKSRDNQKAASDGQHSSERNANWATRQLNDDGAEVVAHQDLQEELNRSPRVQTQLQIAQSLNQSPKAQSLAQMKQMLNQGSRAAAQAKLAASLSRPAVTPQTRLDATSNYNQPESTQLKISSAAPIQFTLKDARDWVKSNTDQTGYPKGWNKTPTADEIRAYIDKQAAGWQELEEAYGSQLAGRKRKKVEPSSKKKSSGRKRTIDEDSSDEETESQQKRLKVAEQEPEEESVKEEAIEEDDKTIREMFRNYLTEFDIKDERIKGLVVDYTFEDIPKEMIKIYQKSNLQDIASCFATAERLFELIGDPASDALDSWKVEKNMGEGITELIKDIEAHKDSNCVYRIGVNKVAHGFTIIIQNGSAEVLQSFAGASGETLAQNIEKEGEYTIPEITGLLSDLIGGSKKSVTSQNKLFDGRIDVEKVPKSEKEAMKEHTKNKNLTRAKRKDEGEKGYAYFYRDLSQDVLQYDRRGLYSQKELLGRIRNKVMTGFMKLGGKIKKK